MYRRALDEEQSLRTQSIDAIPVATASSPSGQKWALYDRRTRTVQVYTLEGEGLVQKLAQSQSVETDKLPKYIAWLDDQTIVLADAISTIWIYSLGSAGTLSLLLSQRLSTRGIFAVQPDTHKPGVFWVGNKDGCTSYQLSQLGQQISIQTVGLHCLQQGVVKQVSVSYICTLNPR